MKITRACDYAMRALIYMADKPSGTIFMRSDLSRLSQVPDSFLGKILQGLVKANILVSVRGKKGGFRFEKKSADVSMFDVINAVEGDLRITECLSNTDFCGQTTSCNLHRMWRLIQDTLTSRLKQTTLKDLM